MLVQREFYGEGKMWSIVKGMKKRLSMVEIYTYEKGVEEMSNKDSLLFVGNGKMEGIFW
jgi:hypothetical protein